MIFISLPLHCISKNERPYNHGWWIRNEIYLWLIGHVGPGNQYGSWQEDQEWMWTYRYDRSPVNNLIGFNDPTHAVLFKLTWY